MAEVRLIHGRATVEDRPDSGETAASSASRSLSPARCQRVYGPQEPVWPLPAMGTCRPGRTVGIGAAAAARATRPLSRSALYPGQRPPQTSVGSRGGETDQLVVTRPTVS